MKKTLNLQYSFQVSAEVVCPKCSDTIEVETSGETLENNTMEECLIETLYEEGWTDDEDSGGLICPNCSQEVYGEFSEEDSEVDNDWSDNEDY